MTIQQSTPALSPEDLQLIEAVYQRRVKYIVWLTKALLFGAVGAAALGFATSGLFNGFWLNPLTWLGLVWSGAIWATVPGCTTVSKPRAILIAPLVFRNEFSRRTLEVRQDQACLVSRFGQK